MNFVVQKCEGTKNVRLQEVLERVGQEQREKLPKVVTRHIRPHITSISILTFIFLLIPYITNLINGAAENGMAQINLHSASGIWIIGGIVVAAKLALQLQEQGQRKALQLRHREANLIIKGSTPANPDEKQRMLEEMSRYKEHLTALLSGNFNEEAVDGIILALDEAMTNAIVHRTGGDVRVRCMVGKGYFYAEVENEGVFDEDKIPDPASPEELQKLLEGGKGIYLMRYMMEKNRGTCKI